MSTRVPTFHRKMPCHQKACRFPGSGIYERRCDICHADWRATVITSPHSDRWGRTTLTVSWEKVDKAAVA